MKPNKERRYFGLFLCVCRGHRREGAGEKFGFMPIFRRERHACAFGKKAPSTDLEM